MASIFKAKGDKRYTILYYDENRKRRKKTGYTDKAETRRLANELEDQARRRRDGLDDPRAEAFREHGARPLAEHLDTWRDTMRNQGHTAKHADQSAERVRRLLAVIFGAKPDDIDGKTMTRAQQEQARATVDRLIAKTRLADVATERVQAALATFRNSGRSAQTCNHYRACVRAFARWCWKTGRLRDQPLIGLTGYNVKEDRRHDRRTVSLEELQRLIAVAERGPDYQAMTGPMRALCYRLAVATGLRLSEIASIAPASFDWMAPNVRVKAAYTKNGQEAELPLPSDLASDLAAYVATLAADAPVFPLPKKGAAMLRADLAVARIEYQDASMLFFDFHAL
jgi:integrase